MKIKQTPNQRFLYNETDDKHKNTKIYKRNNNII